MSEDITNENETEADNVEAVTDADNKAKRYTEAEHDEIKKLRAEARGYRKDKSDLQSKLDAAEADFQKRFDEELSKARAEAKQEARIEIARARFEALAVKEGLSDPDLVALFDTSKFEFDDAGKITNADELLREFRAAKPHFFSSQATSSTTKAPKEADANSKPDLKGMSDADYAAWKKANGKNF